VASRRDIAVRLTDSTRARAYVPASSSGKWRSSLQALRISVAGGHGDGRRTAFSRTRRTGSHFCTVTEADAWRWDVQKHRFLRTWLLCLLLYNERGLKPLNIGALARKAWRRALPCAEPFWAPFRLWRSR